jgi:hypothetical protein
MAAIDFINGIPTWTLAHLGKHVCLASAVDSYGDGSFVYLAGSRGKLDAIQAEKGGPCALVEFAQGDLVSVPFASLMPLE